MAYSAHDDPADSYRRAIERGFMRPVGKPTKVKRTVKANTSNVASRLNSRLNGGEKKVNLASGGEGDFPLDCPVRIEVERVIGEFKHDGRSVEGLMGHILHLDFYTKRHNMRIKLYRDPNAMVIDLDGNEVWRWLEGEEDVPDKFKEYIQVKGLADAAFVEQAELQPGDFVEEDDAGIPVVTRDRAVSGSSRGARKGKRSGSGRKAVAKTAAVDDDIKEDEIEWD